MLSSLQVYALAKDDAVARLAEVPGVIRETAIRQAFPDPEIRARDAPKRRLIDRTILRARKKFRPRDPADVDADLDHEWIQMVAPNLKIIGDLRGNDARIIMFATEFQLQTLNSAQVWFCDGTFRVSSNHNVLALA